MTTNPEDHAPNAHPNTDDSAGPTPDPDGARSGALPEWADEWYGDDPMFCSCGARLVFMRCYCAGHIACSRTGTSPTNCAQEAVS